MKLIPMLPQIVGCLGVFLAAPYLPSQVIYTLVGNYVGVFALLAANLYLLQVNLTLALAFFFACGGLFLEYRKRMLTKIEIKMQQKAVDGTNLAPVSSLSVPAEDLIEGEVHPEHDEPLGDRKTYEPSSEDQTNRFERVGESINEKHVLDTEESTSGLFR
jgi:hypothetical protein